MIWNLLAFEGAKPHFCPQELVADITDDLRVRGCSGRAVGFVSALRVDHGGPLWLGRTYYAVELNGAKIEVPLMELASFLRQLRALPERWVNDKPYYKLHAHIHCIVLSPQLRTTLLSAWEAGVVATQAQTIAELLSYEALRRDLGQHPNLLISASPPPLEN